MTTTDGPLDAVARQVAAVESAVSDAAHAGRQPGPALVAALAAVHERLAALACDEPAARMLRIRALVLDADVAWLRQDAATAIPTFDETVTLCRELVDEGSDTAAEAADRAVEVSTDTAMVFLALGDLDAAEARLRQAESVCETCDVRAVLRLDLLNVWTSVDLARARWGVALRRAEAAVALGRDVGTVVEAGHDVGGESMITAVDNLAHACRYLGDPERALELYSQTLKNPLRTKAQDRSARMRRAVIAAQTGSPDAAPMLLEVVNLARHDQDGERLAHAAATLGSIAQANGQTDIARAWYQTAATAAPHSPPLTAGSYALLANIWPDPAVAAQLRDKARRTVQDAGVELRVSVDFFTSRDSLASGFTEAELDVALPAALVLDVWRIDLPPMLRGPWQQVEQSGGTGPILTLAQDLGRHDLVAALAAHLAATVPPTTGPGAALPPRVLVAGKDPLAGTARAAVERYGRPVRDEQRTCSAYTDADGLDLVAVGRGDVYLCWQRPTGAMHSVRVGREDLDAHLAELELASNAALAPPGGSALLHRRTEADLMRRLGERLLPAELVADLGRTAARGFPRLRVRADGDLAQVPWGLLVVPGPVDSQAFGYLAERTDDTRLVELVDVVTLAPFGLPVPATDADRTARPVGGVLAVLDPRVPGFPADSALGSVLGRMPAGSPLEQRMRTYLDEDRLVAHQPADGSPGPAGWLFRRRDTDRAWLAEALSARPGRLLYLGHASTVVLTDGVTSEPALHLCCSAAVPGNAAPLGAHRPLAASDILADDLRYPARVALVACASGDDARTRDAYGLAHSLLCRGAELVTGLLWPLPTGQWYSAPSGPAGPVSRADRDADDGQADDNPLVALTLAVDQAHESADPVRSLCQWQRDRLHRWRSGQNLLDSPISWGALHTIVPAGR